jgi:protein-arginine kinase
VADTADKTGTGQSSTAAVAVTVATGTMSCVRAIKSILPLRARPNRADRGLYGGKQKLFGNNVSFSNNR